jgi:ElaB/YqjD/DUF883 family membrane-anchored ribosome-binding protein
VLENAELRAEFEKTRDELKSVMDVVHTALEEKTTEVREDVRDVVARAKSEVLETLTARITEVEQGATAGSTVVIGPGDNAVVFDWEPTIIAGSGIAHGPRGTDERLAES